MQQQLRPISKQEVETIIDKITAAAKAPRQKLMDSTYNLVTDSGDMEITCDLISKRLYYKADGKHVSKSLLRTLLSMGLIEEQQKAA